MQLESVIIATLGIAFLFEVFIGTSCPGFSAQIGLEGECATNRRLSVREFFSGCAPLFCLPAGICLLAAHRPSGFLLLALACSGLLLNLSAGRIGRRRKDDA